MLQRVATLCYHSVLQLGSYITVTLTTSYIQSMLHME